MGRALGIALAWLVVPGLLAASPGSGRPAAAIQPAASAPAASARSLGVGVSVQRRPIRALGTKSGPGPHTRVLVVGSIHGNETAGHAVIRGLRGLRPPGGVELWTLLSANPDGAAAGTRQNARGVDLNRNFPFAWRSQGSPFSNYYSGPRPLSEPESRAARRLIRAIRPDVTIWYHQALQLVDLGSGANPDIVRTYSRRARLPARRIGFLPGVATRWQNRRFPGTSAFVVELPAGPLSRRGVRRHVAAARAAARVARQAATSADDAPPAVVRRRIPFGAERKAQMRRYSRRHYGIDDHRLRDPRVIVLHLSVTDTAEAVIRTFARNQPNPELGELPNVCAHYVVAPSGAIYELVSRRLMCRHTVGLNHVSFGIEHVGRRHGDVMGRPRQLRASLRLVRWLQNRYGIRTRNVIGHNESLQSPYHRERVARLRSQTHGDFPRAVARRYRRLLSP